MGNLPFRRQDQITIHLPDVAVFAGVGAVDVSLAEAEAWEPLHGRLRQASPLTALLLQRHRQGLHRAIGDLLPALLAMHKFSVS